MKKIYAIFLLLFVCFAFGQSRMVAKKVQELNTKSQAFVGYDLFSKNNDTQKASKFLTSASDVTVLNLNSQQLGKIMDEAPEFLSIAVPYQNEMIEVQMYKQNILTDDFKVKDADNNFHEYQPGQYYRGIVTGDYNSIVAISFFEDNVMGVISTTEKGNVVLGKSVDKVDYVSYADKNLLGENPFVCGYDELEVNKQMEQQIQFDPNADQGVNTTKCVKIYYEVAHQPYLNNGSNLEDTVDWLTGIQNNIATLYNNDDISVALNMVKVWTYEDPYQGDYGQNLSEFAETVTEFEGDIAHLINTPLSTSVAFLDSLCTGWRYAYSGIEMTYAQVPTYSWTIMAMTHEMGHGFGSPHTHDCAWNGNGTAIDGCGYSAGWGGCPGPIPTEGGTIMSYCHLNAVGINFTLGFGPQPAALIRNTIEGKDCLGTGCVDQDDYCNISIEELTIVQTAADTYQVDFVDETSTAWQYRTYPFGTTPPETWTPINTNSFEISGLTGNQYYEFELINVCEDGAVGRGKTAILLNGDFCDGTLFTDTGGETSGYSDDQHIVKTFYPATGDKVELTFQRIGLQNNQDFMYVYDGDSTDSPLFAEGTLTGNNDPGPTFVSTHTSGAITIEFVSNASVNTYGWEAVVDCSALGIEDVSDSFGITVYPNPASDVLNIASQKAKIQSATITDATGRTVLTNKIASTNGTINIGHLPKGVYILTLKLDGQTVTKKIIKK